MSHLTTSINQHRHQLRDRSTTTAILTITTIILTLRPSHRRPVITLTLLLLSIRFIPITTISLPITRLSLIHSRLSRLRVILILQLRLTIRINQWLTIQHQLFILHILIINFLNIFFILFFAFLIFLYFCNKIINPKDLSFNFQLL